MVEETKKCPFCGGEIRSEAIKCRHCGEFLEESRRPGAAPGAPQPSGPPPSKGVAIAALIFGILGVFPSCLSIVAVILGIIGLSKAGKHPSRPGQGMAIAGLVLGAIGVLFIPIIAAIAIPNLLEIEESKKAASEATAISALRTISSAEELFNMQNGRYATLEELGEANIIDSMLARATAPMQAKYGFYFRLEAGAQEWSCAAIPAVPGGTGSRSFYIDQTGDIRYRGCSSLNDPPADMDSPLLQ